MHIAARAARRRRCWRNRRHRRCWIVLRHVRAQQRNERIALGFVHQRVIRRNARLARIEEFACGDARDVEYGYAVGEQCFDTRTLAEVGADRAREILQSRLEYATRRIIHALRVVGRARMSGRALGLQQGVQFGDRRVH